MSSTLSSLKLIIFDLDGTLIDTIDDLTEAVCFALNRGGFPPRSSRDVTNFVGNGVLKLIERSLPEGHRDAETVGQVHADFNAFYAEHYADKSLPYDGAAETVGRLKAEGYKLAVLSNKPDRFTKALIEKFFPALFDAYLGSSESTPRKPDPTGELSIITSLGLTPDVTLHIGDSDTDIMTAHNAGVRCIGCTWGFRPRATLEAAGADWIVERFENIFGVINDINKKILKNS